MRGTLAERLAAGAVPEPNTGCLLWMKAGTSGGRYGAIRVTGVGPKQAHRMAWELVNGPIPKGMCVCHKCDVTFCINPDHLFLGTHDDNMADKARKGRAGNKKYDAALVREIRTAAAGGETHTEIGRRLGIPRMSITSICRGKVHKFI